MRPWLVAAVVFVAAWSFLGTLEARESGEARVRARVREFTSLAPGAVRRDLVVGELAEADRAVVARIVREAALSDGRRDAALELAARLRLAGVWDLARRWADGPFEPAALALAAEAPEEEAARWLVARWGAADPGSDRFRAADDALRRHRLHAAAVEAIAPHLDGPRAESALAILRDQMAADDACPAELRARWPEAWACYVREARAFADEGADLLGSPLWVLRGARRVGRNVRLAPRDWIALPVLPPRAGVDPGAIVANVLCDAGDGAFVAVSCDAGGPELRVRCDGRAWFLVEGPPRDGARVEAPVRAGDWNAFEFRFFDPRLPDRPAVRDVRVRVNGVELRPSGGFWRLAAPPAAMSVGASTGDGVTVAGGIAWAPAR